MRTATILVALLALSFLCSCSKSPSDQLVGKWTLDTAAMKAALKKEAEADADGMGGMMLGMLDSMSGTAEFKSDGTATIAMNMGPMGEHTDTNKYRVEGSGANLSIIMTDEDGKDESSKLTFDSNDRFSIEMKDDKGMKMVFNRKKG